MIVGYFALQFCVTPSLLRPIFGEDRVFIFNAAAEVDRGRADDPADHRLDQRGRHALGARLPARGRLRLGSTRRQVSLRVVVPAALSGIAASVILAFSRAVGETMAVTIAAGNSLMTLDFFTSIQTLTASIAQTVSGEASAQDRPLQRPVRPRPHHSS